MKKIKKFNFPKNVQYSERFQKNCEVLIIFILSFKFNYYNLK